MRYLLNDLDTDEWGEDAARQRPRRKVCIRVGATLAPLSHAIRRLVYIAMNGSRHRRGRLCDQRRDLLCAAVTQVERDLEHHQPGHPQVRILGSIRRQLEIDLGWRDAEHAA